MNTPQQIYNCDETFMPLDYTHEKAKVQTNVYCQALGTSEHITALCCASAAQVRSMPNYSWWCLPLDDALYVRRESGWIESELV